MKLENRLKDIQIALKLADWFSIEEHVDYNADFSLGYSEYVNENETRTLIN